MNTILKFSTLLLAAMALSACSKSTDGDAQPRAASRAPAPVVAELLRFEKERVRLEAVGTSRARLSADLFSPTSGEVVAVNFEPGQAVKAGDVLVQLDAEKEQLAVRLAELQLEDAKRLYDRYERSAGSGAVLPTALDAARIAAETASVELEKARIALSDRSIEAVFDGYVGSSEVDPGDRVDSNTLITTLDDRRSLFVSFAVPEVFIGELAVNDAVQLRTWSESGGNIDGAIIDIGSRIDPANRTFTVRARVDNENDRLRPGMSFRVRIDVEGGTYALVSETGLQWGADGAYVWSVVDGTATRVPVRIVQRREGQILVDSDLKSGAIIVVEGTQNMRDGIAVNYGTPGASGGRLSELD
jgi:RND family efflux transporter MFP subunit